MRIIRKRELAERLGVSLMTIWRWEKKGNFPRRVQLGQASVGYVEEEIDRWLASRMEQRDAA